MMLAHVLKMVQADPLSDETGRDPFHVDSELTDRHVALQMLLLHTPKGRKNSGLPSIALRQCSHEPPHSRPHLHRLPTPPFRDSIHR